MILLNLVLFVQSFALNATPLRTPLVINEMTGSALMQTFLDDGSLKFEKCLVGAASTNKFEHVQDMYLPCEDITSPLKFTSEQDYQKFMFKIKKNYLGRLRTSFGNRKLSSFLSAILISVVPVIGLETYFPRNNFANPLIRSGSLLVVVGYGAYVLAEIFLTDPLYRVSKVSSFIETLTTDDKNLPPLSVNDEKLLELYERSLQSVAQKYSKSLY